MALADYALASKNNYRIADADEVFDPDRVPIGETNTSVTGGAANRFRIVGAVHSDAGFVQAHPNHADQIIRTGRETVIILGANAVIKHYFVVTEPRPGCRALDFPGANRRRQ